MLVDRWHRPPLALSQPLCCRFGSEFLSLQKTRGLPLRDAHAWPQTHCVWRRTPHGLCSHMDALKQSKWAAAATLGKYNISGLTLPPHVLTFRVGRTLSHPVSGQPSTSKMFSLSKAWGPLTNGCHCWIVSLLTMFCQGTFFFLSAWEHSQRVPNTGQLPTLQHCEISETRPCRTQSNN